MKFATFLALFAAFLFAVSKSDTPVESQWAVLIAGSRHFYNYRHQADICHAYQILIQRGFLPDHIITFSYNDVAPDKENLYMNQLYNHPSLKTDVNKGCHIDYVGEEVTPDNFLAVLRGESPIAGRKTLRSGAEDHVFVNFVDHGGPDILGFPDDDLHSAELMDAFRTMHKKKMYKRMLLLIEACESGSMFEDILPNNMNILAITAANAHESSYATYHCIHLQVFLGDVFSVRWMELADAQRMSTFGLVKEYRYLKNVVKESHVSLYGDVEAFFELTMADFIGLNEPVSHEHEEINRSCNDTLTPSPEVETSLLVRSYLKHVDHPEERDEIIGKLFELLQARLLSKKASEQLAAQLGSHDLPPRKDKQDIFKCYKAATQAFRKHCTKMGQVPEFTANYRVLQTACKSGLPTKTVTQAINFTCSQLNKSFLY